MANKKRQWGTTSDNGIMVNEANFDTSWLFKWI